TSRTCTCADPSSEAAFDGEGCLDKTGQVVSCFSSRQQTDMPHSILRFLTITLLAGTSAFGQRAVAVISIDGMHPDYVLKAGEHGLRIPNLRRYLRDGVHASSVRGVLPTVTSPSHTTMMTGVWPA